MNGLLAKANGVLGKYLEISSSRILECSLTESIVLFIVSCSISFSSKQINSRICKFYFHPIFFARVEVSTGMLGAFLTNLGMLHLVLGETN